MSKQVLKKKKKYVFSIIMSIYNVEDYIEEAINSIINQSFPFSSVQLILVNDGSTDNSKEICLKYQNLYSNIEYYEKENGGLSSARNYGLDHVDGEYVSFIDPDDTISELALEKVNEFFVNNQDINLVGLVVKYFGNKTGIHPRYEKFERETVIVDLEESPQNYILSSAATFYRSKLFDNLRFDTNIVVAEDLYFNCQIYLENSVFGVISSDEAVYNYRIRPTNNSLTGLNRYDIDNFTYTIEFLHSNFKKILEQKNMKMPSFLQYIMIGEIIKRNKALNKSSGEKLTKFHNLCRKVLEDIDIETIKKFYSTNHMFKIALLTLKFNWSPSCLDYKMIDNRLYVNSIKVGLLSHFPLILSKIDIDNNKIRVEGVYNDIIPNNKNILFRFKDSDLKTYDIKIEETDNEFYLNKTLGITFNKACRIECELPIKNTIYKPFIKIAGMDIKIEFNVFEKFSLFDKYISKDDEPFCLFSRNKILKIDNYTLEVKNKEMLSEFIYNRKKDEYIRKNYPTLDLYRRYNKKKKKYIIINDRPMMANDNGQALFEYINKVDKKMAKYTYFAISKDSKDYDALKKIGNVVEIGSHHHKKLFINSKAIISSHANFYNHFNELENKLNRDILKYKFIFLQHGVIINNVHKPLNRPKSGIDMFVTSTEAERNEILTPKYMFNTENVVTTGLPRFDKLKNNRKKLIVIAPTWRTFLSGPINKCGFHDAIADFDKSEYFIKWSKVLSDKDIIEKCRKEKYQILFVLHPGFKNYHNYFSDFENDIIKIKDADDIVYSNLFSELSLMITDYSSIMFDVGYLKKPIIFYQFDQDAYFEKHYKPGYFSYEKDGFGSVLKNHTDLKEKVLNYFDNGFKLEDKYINNIEKTFKYIDKNNCKRLYNKILELLEKNN